MNKSILFVQIVFVGVSSLLLCCTNAQGQQSRPPKLALSPDSNVSPADIQKGLSKSCPQVVLTMDSGKADFILSANVGSRVIDGTVYEGKSGYALFNSSGDLVFSTKTRYQKNAIKDVCNFIQMHAK